VFFSSIAPELSPPKQARVLGVRPSPPHLTNNSRSFTLSPATVEQALKTLAQKEQEKEEELGKKASSNAARRAAKENKLALQVVAADERNADKEKKEKKEKEKEERDQKIAQRKREREEARLAPPPKEEETGLQVSIKQAPQEAGNQATRWRCIRCGRYRCGLEATPVSLPKGTRSGRNISLPSKFRSVNFAALILCSISESCMQFSLVVVVEKSSLNLGHVFGAPAHTA
jgi:hypothetical protein